MACETTTGVEVSGVWRPSASPRSRASMRSESACDPGKQRVVRSTSAQRQVCRTEFESIFVHGPSRFRFAFGNCRARNMPMPWKALYCSGLSARQTRAASGARIPLLGNISAATGCTPRLVVGKPLARPTKTKPDRVERPLGCARHRLDSLPPPSAAGARGRRHRLTATSVPRRWSLAGFQGAQRGHTPGWPTGIAP
jgi:hypothetical protein